MSHPTTLLLTALLAAIAAFVPVLLDGPSELDAIQGAAMTITHEIKVITPAMAIAFLEHTNTGNRRLRLWWAEALASSIRRGEWITTHQGIAFTKSGRLIDGQHRIKAIALANKSVEISVFKGVPDEAFSVIDVGVKRSTSDTTGLPKKTAEVARFLTALSYGYSNCTSQMVRQVADCGVAEIHERLTAYCSTSTAIFSAAPVRAAAVLLVMDGCPEEVVFKTYSDTLHQNFNSAPTVAQGFIRQVIAKKVSASNHIDLLARALKFLNPANADLTKIQCTDADASAAAEFGRTIIKRVVS